MATAKESFETIHDRAISTCREISNKRPGWWKKQNLYRETSRNGNNASWVIYHSGSRLWVPLVSISHLSTEVDDTTTSVRSVTASVSERPVFAISEYTLTIGDDTDKDFGVAIVADPSLEPNQLDLVGEGKLKAGQQIGIPRSDEQKRASVVMLAIGARLDAIDQIINGEQTFAEAFAEIPH